MRRQLYSNFWSHTNKIFFVFFPTDTYSLYVLDCIASMILDRTPSKTRITYFSISAVINVPLVSMTAISQLSYSSIVVVIKNDSVASIGNVASKILICFSVCCRTCTFYPLYFHNISPSVTLAPASLLRAVYVYMYSS